MLYSVLAVFFDQSRQNRKYYGSILMLIAPLVQNQRWECWPLLLYWNAKNKCQYYCHTGQETRHVTYDFMTGVPDTYYVSVPPCSTAECLDFDLSHMHDALKRVFFYSTTGLKQFCSRGFFRPDLSVNERSTTAVVQLCIRTTYKLVVVLLL